MRIEHDAAGRRSSTGGAVATAVILGAAVGAAAALLFAPRTGAETRRQLRHTADRLKDRAGSLLEDANYSVARELRRRGRRVRRTLERLG
jgi:gas vesicle protein